ncbi:hypothetical protein DH2020_002004 [Rehmannia glutinosa]|uniref:AT-hook motif nuclear-localized protein n=1 Tax=Rehmannia glutinosa TaxID=99300 RepID=A0ABR0XSW8_REHGL
MDSQDSTAPPPHFPNHHPQPSPPSHASVLLGPHSQAQQHMHNNSYPISNNNSSFNPNNSATNNTSLHQQNPGFPFNSLAAGGGPKPLDHLQSDGPPSGGGGNDSGSGGGFNIEPARKKRGRPRKYSPDNSIGLGLSPAPATQISSVMAHNDSSSGGGGNLSSETAAKRNRGRPPGSVKKQLDALGVPGVGFTPHVITVNAGEDIASKIMAFSQQGPRTVCILSANGAICNVTLRQPANDPGRFEIISLSGSFLLSESNGNRSRTGGLSVSLAGPDGRVLGGGVAGMLKAASPVQVVVGSFIADAAAKKSYKSPPPPPSSQMLNFGPGGGASPPSPGGGGGSSESGDDEINDDDDDSPLNQRVGSAAPGGPNYAAAQQAVHQNNNNNMAPMYSPTMGWPNSIKMLPN